MERVSLTGFDWLFNLESVVLHFLDCHSLSFRLILINSTQSNSIQLGKKKMQNRVE